MQLNESATDLTSHVAGEVRAVMARKRLTQQQLATALGWTQSYLARRLKGTTPFDVADLDRLATVLGVPVGTFFPFVPAAA